MKSTVDIKSYSPVAFEHHEEVKDFLKKKKQVLIVDEYERNLEELFLLRNPKYKFNKEYATDFVAFLKKHYSKKAPDASGKWFYFPWSNRLVHYLDERLHFELRTGRNEYLITEKEQKKYYNFVVGILGMSVGSHAVSVIAMTGGAKHVKIADPDTLSGDNLNRIRDGFDNVGTPKVVLVARKIYEINPYAKIDVFLDGITKANAQKFFSGLDIVVEAMDNPYWKLKAREIAKAKTLPVLMATDNGDGIIMDVERFDTDKNLPILHGLVGNITADGLMQMNPADLPRIATRIAGANLVTPRMLHSVSEVGLSLYSWPQLGTAANLCGTVVPYIVRRIACGDKKIKSGRYDVSLDAIFEDGYHSPASKKKRGHERKRILRKMGF